MLTTYPLDAPAKRAADPYFAVPGEAVDGADLRVNATGGMRMVNRVPIVGTASTAAVSFAGDFSVVHVIRNREWDAGIVGLFDQADNGLTIYTQGDDIKFAKSSITLLATATGAAAAGNALYGPLVALIITSEVGVITITANGTELCSLAVDTSTVTAQAMAPFGGETTGLPTQDSLRSRITNFAPTADEAEGAAKGESRGRLAYRGYALGQTTWTGDSADTLTSVTATGFTNDRTATTDGTGPVATHPLVLVGGDTVRVRCFVTLNSGSATDLPIVAFSGFSPTPLVYLVPGANDVTFNIPGTFEALQLWHWSTAGNTGVCNYTISGFSLVREGTVASYEPGNCTSLNRWLDNSGNNYHLLPVGGAKALNPQVETTRAAEFRFDVAGPTQTDGPADWTLSSPGVGVVTATPPAYAKLIKPPVGLANSETTGHVVNPVTNQSTGVITFTASTGGVATNSIIAGTLNWRE
jgi:hypothetical protein